MTRLWSSGAPIRMTFDGSRPQRFIWQGRAHPVEAVLNCWRVDVGWWRLRIWRDYYTLATTTGLLVVVYRDGLSDEWRLQRVYD